METPSSETYLKNMFDWDDNIDQERMLIEQSEIVKFYDDCNVLITGGSGFMGKLLVEKLLRSCKKIRKLFLLMRAKKGKTPEERFKEHFEDIIYNRLKSEMPNFASKVVMIEGQMEDNGLGLTPENRQMLLCSNVVFHGAATVRFDETLRFAVNVNVRGTREILLLAKDMPNLKAFVHIGTAFSQCVTKVIDEVFYAPPICGDKLLNLLDILDDEQLKFITPTLVGHWPNTYAFTKAVAEDIVRRYNIGVPTCIVRPSIVIATSKEPIAGWINNFYGPTGVVAGAGIGLLRTLHCEEQNIADIIPADFVINNIIAAAWDVADLQKQEEDRSPSPSEDSKSPRDPKIYNSVSSCQNPITWGEFRTWNAGYGLEIPSSMCLWYYWFNFNRHLWIHNIYVGLFHFVPAVILDTLAMMTGRKPMLLKAYRKIHKFSCVISYFATQQWTFRNESVVRLWNRLNAADRELFELNVVGLVWGDYFFTHIRGLRRFILNDPAETIPKGLVKQGLFKKAHYTLMTLGILFLVWLGYTILRSILSLLW